MQAKTRLSTLPAFASIPALRSGTPPAVLPSLPQDTGDDRIRHPVENLLFSPSCRLRSLSCLPGNFRKNRSKSSRFLRRSLRFESLITLGKKNLDSKKNIETQTISSAGTTGFEPVEYRHQKPGAYRLPTSQKN